MTLCEGGRRFIVIIFIEILVPIMFIVVVTRPRVSIAGLSLLVLGLPSLVSAGLLAPPYHLNLV